MNTDKVYAAHGIARIVLAMLESSETAKRIAARCGNAVIECLEADARLTLRMNTEDGCAICLTKLRFWLFAARECMKLTPLVDETPDEAVNRKAMEWDINPNETKKG